MPTIFWTVNQVMDDRELLALAYRQRIGMVSLYCFKRQKCGYGKVQRLEMPELIVEKFN